MERNIYFSQIFKEKIKEWCKANGCTQAEFADAVGIHPNMVSRYTKGKAYPAEELLKKMCSVFGCSYNDFIPVVKKEKTLADYTTDELLAEIKRRIEEK